jgi:hypothetical protein
MPRGWRRDLQAISGCCASGIWPLAAPDCVDLMASLPLESSTMIRSCLSIAFLAVVLAAFGPFCKAARATQTYCVGSVSELQDALTAAETDGDESRIDIRTGTYNLGSSLVYKPVLYFIPTGKLTIEGGYSVGCASRTDDASLTVLHGDGSQFLRAYADNASILVKTLSFDQVSIDVTNFVFGDDCASTNLVFEFRRIRVDGGVLFVNAIICHDIVVRDSLFTNGYASNSNIPGDSSVFVYTVQNVSHPAKRRSSIRPSSTA